MMIFTQRIGVTASLPHEVPPYLESTAHNWIYRDTSLWHDGQVVRAALPNISGLNTGQSVGLQLTLDGQLHIYINGRYRECGASGLPVHKPLWGALDVFARCIKIKSELLYGRWMVSMTILKCYFLLLQIQRRNTWKQH